MSKDKYTLKIDKFPSSVQVCKLAKNIGVEPLNDDTCIKCIKCNCKQQYFECPKLFIENNQCIESKNIADSLDVVLDELIDVFSNI